MPSAVILAQKQATVKELAEKLQTAKSAVIVNYQGITVEDDTKMRAALRNASSQESGLYYLQSRYYDPELCRFLNIDSVFDTDAGIQGYYGLNCWISK